MANIHGDSRIDQWAQRAVVPLPGCKISSEHVSEVNGKVIRRQCGACVPNSNYRVAHIFGCFSADFLACSCAVRVVLGPAVYPLNLSGIMALVMCPVKI